MLLFLHSFGRFLARFAFYILHFVRLCCCLRPTACTSCVNCVLLAVIVNKLIVNAYDTCSVSAVAVVAFLESLMCIDSQ